jgi:tetratricopeptide (TPR) repeat protein
MGEDRVFMDVEDISPGQNFAQKIDQTIGTCRAVLVVIGPKWLQVMTERAEQKQEDYVRHEIESALGRKTTVIPIFVGGATAAQLTGVPTSLADLPFHQAVTLHDESFKDDCDRLARSLGGTPKRRWRNLLLAAAAVVVIAALGVLVFSKHGIASWNERKQRQGAVAQLLTTAQIQTRLKEYEAAYRTCTQAVKIAPANKQALDRQLDAAMLWLENYRVRAREDEKAADIAAPQLTELMAVLDAGLARISLPQSSGKEPRAANILAHIGWAHWLNQHIAEKEFGHIAERAFRQAIEMEPANVYANSMLGNWLLQTDGSLQEAVQHFATALATGKKRSLVRVMQIAGLVYSNAPGSQVEAVKALNDMRKNNEPLVEGYKRRCLSADFEPNNSAEFLTTIYTAVPPEDLGLTYAWLDDAPNDVSDNGYRQAKRDFVQAKVLSLEGKKAEAAAAFKALEARMKAQQISGRLMEHVKEELAHLA